MFPTASGVPAISTEQMREVDRIMMEDLRIDLVRMMENAGRALAMVAYREFLDPERGGTAAIVLAGSGGNGGGAMVAARRLVAWGVRTTVVTTRPLSALRGVPRDQAVIAGSVGAEVLEAAVVSGPVAADVIIDGVIGYSLAGPPVGRAEGLIAWANASDTPIVSLDVPSGIDATTGESPGVAMAASATVTLALPKHGLFTGSGATKSGEVYLADIGVPVTVYEDAFDLDVGRPFARGDIVRIADR